MTYSGQRPFPSRPLITIAIPTYNRASLVSDCVKSALAQSYRNIEVLVSDNASEDNTVTTLKSINDERLRILTNSENVGANRNFDKCVREAKGDYLVLAGDDTLFDTQFVEKCVEVAAIEPGIPIVVSYSDVLVLDEFYKHERRLLPAKTSKRLSTGIWQGTEILKEYLSGRMSAQLLSSIIRTDILRRNGGYSSHPCAADYATWVPILLEGRAGLVNERCVTGMIHKSTLSERFSADERLSDLCAAVQEISAVVARKVPNPTMRRQIQRLAVRYTAYTAMANLVIYRRAGASLLDVMRKFLDWGSLIGQCTLADFVTTMRLRTLGRILLPPTLVRWLILSRIDRVL